MNQSKNISPYTVGIIMLLTLIVSPLAFSLSHNAQGNIVVPNSLTMNNSDSTSEINPAFAVVGSIQEKPALRNFYFLLGNESISYSTISPIQITNSASLDNFSGLIVWTMQGGYNSSSILQFAKSHVVIVDIRDFCGVLYPSLNSSARIVSNSSVVYDVDWGNFRSGDIVEMRNETGKTNRLTSVLTASLRTLNNITIISQFDSIRTATFFMNGTQPKSGFYVMDLDATTNSTEFTGIWHLFPAVKMVQDFSTGEYAAWTGNGTHYWSLNWITSRTNALATQNSDIAKTSTIGQSVQGRNITALFIGHGPKYAIIDGALHGNEKTGAFACLRTTELLISYYRSDSYWQTALSEYTIVIIPVLNPDGYVNDSRYNANGIDLNQQFPPDGTPTQPEALALINLMTKCKPSVYVNMHEGYYWYPLMMIYGNYENASTTLQTTSALQAANQTFTNLNHYGRFTEYGQYVWIGKVNTFVRCAKQGAAISYASYQYQASCMLTETFVWSDTWGARQCLWAMDYYPCVTIAFLEQQIPRRFVDDFESGGFGSWDGNYVTPGATAVITQTLCSQGKYSAQFASAGTGVAEEAYLYKSMPNSPKLYAGAYFYVVQSGIKESDDCFHFIEFWANGTNIAYAGWQQTGGVVKWVLAIRNATDWAVAYSNAAPLVRTWYHTELNWIKDAVKGQAQLFVSGTLLCSLGNLNTTAFGNINQVRFGLPEISRGSATSVLADFCLISQLPSWDINQDGVVNLQDLVILVKAYNSSPGSANWNPMADINGDGKVSLSDIVSLANHYGQHYQ